MRKKFNAMVVVCMCAAAVLIGAAARAQEESETTEIPALEKGWNIISVPCTVRVEYLKNGNAAEAEFFTWDGEKYVSPVFLDRGKGYIVSVKNIVNVSSFCDKKDITEKFNIQLKKGWNLVGNPFHKSVSVSELLGDSAQKIAVMYQYRGSGYVSLGMNEKFKPFRGYWVYVSSDVDIQKEQECRLAVKAFTDSAREEELDSDNTDIALGESLFLSAKYICEENGFAVLEPDVTEEVEWEISTGEFAAIQQGEFKAIEYGSYLIKSSYQGKAGNSITVGVFDENMPDCEKLVLVHLPTKGTYNDDENGYFSYATDEYIPNEYRNKGSQCTMWPGEKVITCRPYGYKIGGMVWNRTGREMELRAFCAGGEGKILDDAGTRQYEPLMDVTEAAKWTIEETNIAKHISGGRFMPESEGMAFVKAEFNGIESPLHTIAVEGFFVEELALLIPAKYGYSCWSVDSEGRKTRSLCYDADNFVAEGEEFRANVRAKFRLLYRSRYHSIENKESDFVTSRYMNVTDSVEWKIGDKRVINRVEGNLFRGESPGISGLTAYWRGSQTSDQTIKVIEKGEPAYMRITPPKDSKSMKYYSIMLSGEELPYRAVMYYYPENNDCVSSCELRTSDITNIAQWSVTNRNGNIDKGLYSSEVPGTATIVAEYHGVVSQNVDITVENGSELVAVRILPASSKDIFWGDEVVFKAYSVDKADEHKCGSSYRESIQRGCAGTDVSGEVEWKLDSSKDVGSLHQGAFKANNTPGSAVVKAEYKGMVSNSVAVRVHDRDAIYKLIMTPSGSSEVAFNKKVEYKVYAQKASDYLTCNYFSMKYVISECGAVEVTDDVTWHVKLPKGDSSFDNGELSTGTYPGTASVMAEYEGVSSAEHIVVIGTKIIMALRVQNYLKDSLDLCPHSGCFGAKVGGTVSLRVWGREQPYAWLDEYDVTKSTTWRISDPGVAEIGEDGVLNAKKPGAIWIQADFEGARSEKVWVFVYGDEPVEYLTIGIIGSSTYKPLKPLKVGKKYRMVASLYKISQILSSCNLGAAAKNNLCQGEGRKDIIEAYDVTQEVKWQADGEGRGSFQENYFIAESAGFVDVSASLDGMTSNQVTIDVWDDVDLNYCDENGWNLKEWSDDLSSAQLETDCSAYSPEETVSIRYTAYLLLATYLDNCLDLYIMDDNDNIVKTLREEGCSNEDLRFSTNKSYDPKVYQYLSEWDQTDDAGNKVEPGRYYAVARFYIMYEPVIRLPIDIIAEDQGQKKLRRSRAIEPGTPGFPAG